MVKAGLSLVLVLVAACAKPVELPMVSGADLAPAEASFAPANVEAPQLATVEVETDAADLPRRGLFGRLFGKRGQNTETPVNDTVQPVEDTAENADEIPVDNAAESAEEKPRRGLFGLFGKRTDTGDETAPETSGTAVAAAIESTNPAQGVMTEGGDTITAQEAAELAKPEKPRRGLFGLFGRRKGREDAVQEGAGNTVVASIDPDTLTDAEPALEHRKGTGEIPLGTVLPYGQVGVACNVGGRKLGKVIDQFNQRGSVFRLYDTKPGSVEPRTYFVTGFKDGCPRQFTGAMASFGSPVLHERMRFDSYNKGLAITETDRAYDKIRKRVCKTRGKTLCPQERVGALEAETAYITVYERFGANMHWTEILLHKGKLVATSMR